MTLPIGVLTVYAALLVWAGLLARGVQQRSFRLFLYFGIGLMLFLNVGYLIFGVPASIASFIGIYDVLINLGLDPATEAAAISSCADNACTVWGDRYVNHPAWGAAFYDRFANGPAFRSTLLYGHIIFNSLVFVLMHVQLFRPGYGDAKASHKLLGRLSFLFLTISVVCAVWLASEHAPVTAYGGAWSNTASIPCRPSYMAPPSWDRRDPVRRRAKASRLDVPFHRLHVGVVLAVPRHALRAGSAAARGRGGGLVDLYLGLGTVGHLACRTHPPAIGSTQTDRRRRRSGRYVTRSFQMPLRDLPAGLTPYRKTATFTEASLPDGLRTEHRTKAGVWGVIHVTAGRLRYEIPGHGLATVIGAGEQATIEPEVPHKVEPQGTVAFHIEFWRRDAD